MQVWGGATQSVDTPNQSGAVRVPPKKKAASQNCDSLKEKAPAEKEKQRVKNELKNSKKMSAPSHTGLCTGTGSGGPSQTVLVTNNLPSDELVVHVQPVGGQVLAPTTIGPGAQFHRCTRETNAMIASVGISAVRGTVPDPPYGHAIQWPILGQGDMTAEFVVSLTGVQRTVNIQ